MPLTILPRDALRALVGRLEAGRRHGLRARRPNKIIAKGDYCSTSNKPGDCQDSFWLSATFAAAAVKINDGSSEPTCQGASDGGTDGGTDSGADSGDAAGD